MCQIWVKMKIMHSTLWPTKINNLPSCLHANELFSTDVCNLQLFSWKPYISDETVPISSWECFVCRACQYYLRKNDLMVLWAKLITTSRSRLSLPLPNCWKCPVLQALCLRKCNNWNHQHRISIYSRCGRYHASEVWWLMHKFCIW